DAGDADGVEVHGFVRPGDRRFLRPVLLFDPFDTTAKGLGNGDGRLFAGEQRVDGITRIEAARGLRGVFGVVDAAVVAQPALGIEDKDMGCRDGAILFGGGFGFAIVEIGEVVSYLPGPGLHVVETVADV